MVRSKILVFLAALLLSFHAQNLDAASGRALTVFAAASLKGPLDAVAEAFETQSGQNVTVSYAGSATLAKQIESGAPADIYLSADLKWMDFLVEERLVDVKSVVRLLGNQLVLVAGSSSAIKLSIAPGFDLAGALGKDGLLAMGDPKSVPAGNYARQSLESLGVWSQLEKRITSSDNVRVALSLVSRGETPLGIVYETDAALDKSVRIIGAFPPASHDPIIYPVAAIKSSVHPATNDFVMFLRSAAALAIFRVAGFSSLPGS